MVWVGGLSVIEGKMTVGGIAQFIVYVSMLSWPIISIGWVTSIIQRAASAQIRLNEIFNIKPDSTEGETGIASLKKFHGAVSFRNVQFHYPGQENNLILKNITLDIAAGSKVAIVGATGSGKTTLVNLIPRLYEPVNGSVLIDGQDIKKLPLKQLRELIGFVPQVNFLFSDTIENNINWGSRDNDADEVIEASRIAMLYDDVQEFPDGFQTMLGEKGINLSGGQKQRTCIARAIAWKPQLLVLDDALSAVDTDTEARLFDALLQKLPDTTIILISHRISTVKNCDRIVVLKNGTIAESGTHEELLQQQHIYAELYNQQLLEEEILSIS